ncbi:hypothetical protein [Streptomyces doudnae]|uniref:Uncharacterized protein n=1 Tax=Streptomyces doudnae TaxID=3075536 RepID=A0ABD5ER36_9ACTN|nr:hypothetical protein [Streptomyces sp. DSM 41981]MDT0436819.1 hypothetical protein [Streptomyces sp. DSM 41981]
MRPRAVRAPAGRPRAPDEGRATTPAGRAGHALRPVAGRRRTVIDRPPGTGDRDEPPRHRPPRVRDRGLAGCRPRALRHRARTAAGADRPTGLLTD